MHNISVVICAYTQERWNDLVAAVTSVQQQTLLPSEIIVAIDYNPALFKQVQQHISSVIVVENAEAQGVSGTRNSGIAVAKGRIIAFLDDDAIATENWLELLNEVFTDPQVLGVGGPVNPLWQAHHPAWFPEEFNWVVGCTHCGVPQTVARVRELLGGNMAMRREVFDRVGNLRTDIGRIGGAWPTAGEDTELCIRVLQQWPHGVLLYQPKAIVFQRVPNKRANLHYFCLRCYTGGLSRAAIAQFVGVKGAVASPRSYTLKILPQGIVRGLKDAVFHRDLSGFTRAGAIVLGFLVTTAGYLVGTAFPWTRRLPTIRYSAAKSETRKPCVS